MIRELSPYYQQLVEVAWQGIYQQMMQYRGGRRILLVGPMMNNFVHMYAARLVEDFLVVVVDPSKAKMTNTRNWTSDYHKDIVLIAGDIGDWPLKHGIVDIYIDDFCSGDSLFAYNQIFCDAIVPFLKPNAQAYGVFPQYTDAPRTCFEFNKDHPETDMAKFDIKYVRSRWEESGIRFSEAHLIGRSKAAELSFKQNVERETFRFYSWHGHRA
jgi:hypothetical protein